MEKVLIAYGIGDAPGHLVEEGLEIAEAYFQDTGQDFLACYIAADANEKELGDYWIEAEKRANRVLAANSSYDHSMIMLDVE